MSSERVQVAKKLMDGDMKWDFFSRREGDFVCAETDKLFAAESLVAL